MIGMPEPRKLEPLELPMVPFAVAGIVAFAVVGVVLLIVGGHPDWVRICVAGFLLGFPGLAVMIRHDANRRRRP